MGEGHTVWFTEDAGEFLARAEAHLARSPVTSTVVATIARRLAAAAERRRTGRTAPYCWFATVSDPAGAVVGAAMRTAPFEPYPPYVLPMADDAARALGEAVVARGEKVGGVNGARPAADVVAATIAAATGGEVTVSMHTRLFELGTLVDPRPVPGRLRPITDDEVGLSLAWIRQFLLDADEQAGRAPGSGHDPNAFTVDDVLRKRDEDVLWVWADQDDRPVHLTGANPPAYGVARVGPVYTPKEMRGRGYASAAVAQVSRILRGRGARVTLFTDQANPTSNGIYIALGYQAVIDTVDLRIG